MLLLAGPTVSCGRPATKNISTKILATTTASGEVLVLDFHNEAVSIARYSIPEVRRIESVGNDTASTFWISGFWQPLSDTTRYIAEICFVTMDIRQRHAVPQGSVPIGFDSAQAFWYVVDGGLVRLDLVTMSSQEFLMPFAVRDSNVKGGVIAAEAISIVLDDKILRLNRSSNCWQIETLPSFGGREAVWIGSANGWPAFAVRNKVFVMMGADIENENVGFVQIDYSTITKSQDSPNGIWLVSASLYGNYSRLYFCDQQGNLLATRVIDKAVILSIVEMCK